MQCSLEDVSESREEPGCLDVSWDLARGALATLHFSRDPHGRFTASRVTLWLKPASEAGACVLLCRPFDTLTLTCAWLRRRQAPAPECKGALRADRGVDDVFAHLLAHCMQLRVCDGVLQRSAALDASWGPVVAILAHYRTVACRLYAIALDVTRVTLDVPLVGRVRWDWRGSVALQMICLRRAIKVCCCIRRRRVCVPPAALSMRDFAGCARQPRASRRGSHLPCRST